MDALSALTTRGHEQRSDATPTVDTNRALTVRATYRLSEDGRKASLLAGGNGRAVQELTVPVSANRLHLVSVDAQGVARLRVQPRYQLDADRGVVRIEGVPTYDAPPDLDELFHEAARNHQLERTYQAQQRAATATRRESDADRRAQLARTFLDDGTQRALAHPAPTPTRCYLATDRGRLLFDARTDEAFARDVPREAHRRFRADVRGRHDEHQRVRLAQLAVHAEKIRVITEWIGTHGTPDQRVRLAAGVLPMDEALQAITDEAFAATNDRPRYARDGATRLQAHLRQFPSYADVVVTRLDLAVTSAHAATASAAQWALVEDLRATFPDATVRLRTHRLAWKRDRAAPTLTVYGVLVTLKRGPFTVRREFAAPGDELAS